MKLLDPIAFDFTRCLAELGEFQALLAAKAELSESSDVLPFFRGRRQLAALLGLFNPRIAWADRIAYEFDVFGDFACDLVVGEWVTGEYCLIEFEDGKRNSVFEPKTGKATREWGWRFDHGFSQIVDWCYKFGGTGGTDLLARFGRHRINFETVLIVGRDHHLDAGELARLDWRANHVTVNSKKVYCVTFDRLLAQLTTRVNVLSAVAPPAANPGQAPP